MLKGGTYRVLRGASEKLKFVLYSLELLPDLVKDRTVGWEVHKFVAEDYGDDVQGLIYLYPF